MKNYILLLVFTIVGFSCSTNDEIPVNQENLLLGTWVNPQYNNGTITFKRASTLIENEYGLELKENGHCIERTSGFCGTPPITFYDIDGVWEQQNDTLNITIGFQPHYNLQRPTYSYKVLSVTNTSLQVEIVQQTFEENQVIASGELFGNGQENIEKGNSIINTETEWEELLTKMNSVNEAVAPTEINFEEYQVIAIFDEVLPYGGRNIQAFYMEQEDKRIIQYGFFTDATLASTIILQPFLIFKIKKDDTPIIFEEI